MATSKNKRKLRAPKVADSELSRIFDNIYDELNKLASGPSEAAAQNIRITSVTQSELPPNPVFEDVTVDTLLFNTSYSPTGNEAQGTFYWNSDEETVSLITNGSRLDLGHALEVEVKANDPSQTDIQKGTVVSANGTVGASGRITVKKFQAGTDPTKTILGITSETIVHGGDGKAIVFGKIRKINTADPEGGTWNEGDILYAGTLAGELTKTEPGEGAVKLPIAYVVTDHQNNGEIFVRVTPIDENMDADKLDGQHGSYYLDYNNFNNTPTDKYVSSLNFDSNDFTVDIQYNDGSPSIEGLSWAHTHSQYLTTEANDLTSAVTWANVPDANITQSSVTQHESALSIDKSQITNFGVYDNYQYWTLTVGLDSSNITSTDAITFIAGDNVTLEKSGSNITINSSLPVGAIDTITTDTNSGLSSTESSGEVTITLDLDNLEVDTTVEAVDFIAFLDGPDTKKITLGNIPLAVFDNTATGFISDYTVTQSDVTQHQSALAIAESQITFTSEFIELGDLSVATQPASGGGSLNYNVLTGVFTFEPAAIGTFISFADLGVTNDPASGGGNLAYDNAGNFTFTPPDLTPYLTEVTSSDVTQHEGDLTIDKSQITNFGTYDNYVSWTITDGLNSADIIKNYPLEFRGTGAASVSFNPSNKILTIDVTDDNDNYYPVTLGSEYQLNTKTLKIAVTGTDDVFIDLSSIDANELDGNDGSYYLNYNNFTNTPTIPDISNKIELTDLSVAIQPATGGGDLDYDNTTGVFTFYPASIPDVSNFITRTDISVGTPDIASGSGDLSYNSVNGVFTYTPPDLSPYLTSYTETNDLSSAVTWANVPDANITSSSVTQHIVIGLPTPPSGGGALAFTNGEFIFTPASVPDVSNFITLSEARQGLSVAAPGQASGGGSLSYSSVNGAFTYTPPDLSPYLTSETNDLTSAVTWANVPDANITSSSVTQHIVIGLPTPASGGGALAFTNNEFIFTPADVPDVSSFITLSEARSGLSVGIPDQPSGNGGLSYTAGNGTFTYTPPDLSSYLTEVTSSDVTQHQADLVIDKSQITNFGTYDNYGSWSITDGTNSGNVTSSKQISFLGGGATNVSYNDSTGFVTITSTDTNTDTNYYLNGANWATGTGVLTLNVQGSPDVTVDLDGRYLTSLPSHNHDDLYYTETEVNNFLSNKDNYQSWTVKAGTNQEAIASGNILEFAGAGAASVAYDATANKVTITSTDTNTDTNWYPTNGGTSVASGVVTLGGVGMTDVTIDLSNEFLSSHPNTSSLNGTTGGNDDGVVIEDITVDSNGHVTAIGTRDLDGRFDKYDHWSISDGSTTGDVSSGNFVTFVGTNDASVTYDNSLKQVTIDVQTPAGSNYYLNSVTGNGNSTVQFDFAGDPNDLASFSHNFAHNHDDLYYTESEVNTLLNSYLTTSTAASTYVSKAAPAVGADLDMNSNTITEVESIILVNKEGEDFNTTSGRLMFDENFYSDTEYGSTAVWTTNGGGLVIRNEDGWGRILSDKNMQYLNATFASVASSGAVTGSNLNVSNWDTAYGWGNHASAGYLTSETSHADVVVDGDFTVNGLMKRTGAGTYTTITDNSSNWNSAYTYSQVGHLPLTGGTLTGTLTVQAVMAQSNANPKFQLIETDTTDENKEIMLSGGDFFIRNLNDNGTVPAGENILKISHEGAVTLLAQGSTTATNLNALFQDASGNLKRRTLGSLAYSSATYDNYGSWTIADDGTATTTQISSGNTLNIVGGTGITSTLSGSTLTISATNNGDITGVTAGTGLSGGGTSGAVTLNLDFSELTDMTADVSGSTELILQNGIIESRKAISEVKLSAFNNDSGWTSNVGDITGVTAGSGISGGGTSGTVTISHADTSSQGSVNNSGGTVIQDVTLDTYGHVTGLVSYNLDGRYYTESEADGRFVNVTGDTMSGDLTISGTLSATVKSFNIKHPTQEGKRLVYGVLEGNEHAVFVRGKSQCKCIGLPEEWKGLVDPESITVQLTSIGNAKNYYFKEYKDNKIYIGCSSLNWKYNYFYIVHATRIDVKPLQTVQNAN